MKVVSRTKLIDKNIKKLVGNDRGQGATEYILLLVVVVALVMFFKKDIQSTVSEKIQELKGMISGVKGE